MMAVLTDRRALVVQALLTAGIGLLALWVADASTSSMIVQIAALVVGAVLAVALALTRGSPGRVGSTVILGLSVILLLATLGQAGGEVHRWIAVGPIVLQPASILLPLIVWVAATRRADWMTGGLTAVAALLLTAQPDAASATGLALALVGVAVVRRPNPPEIAALICAFAGAAWAWTRFDPLPAVPTVERIISTAFGALPIIGVLAGIALILIPAPFLLRVRFSADPIAADPMAISLGGLWIGLVVANLVGNYPAPVIGYGASLVLGWLISLGLVARQPSAPM